MKITIDDKQIETDGSKTILSEARDLGIDIPTLCHFEGFPPQTSCFLCVVEVEKSPKLIPSCATKPMDGMVIRTNTQKVLEARKLCLELLLSAHWGDCLSPCQNSCPAGIDIQGFIKLIKMGKYEESLALIKEKAPFPSTLGRVCPAFCEESCRRGVLEGSLSIRLLKRFVGDWGLKNPKSTYEVSCEATIQNPKSGKRVAVVGAGPAGLSCAYYLARMGYAVTVFDAQNKPGGMLRYGIPEYRLPKEILDAEISGLGLEIITGKSLGRDIQIQRLRRDFEAVFIGIGAQKSQRMGVDGEDSHKVISGIEFLKQVVENVAQDLGKRVLVVGGGNTAIDSARVAKRLGCDVTILYRRTRLEMPASKEEIEDAEAEGIKIEFLVAPTKVTDIGLAVSRMELGEPDSSGRRKPVAIKGSEFIIECDKIISAIGQAVDIPEGIKADRLIPAKIEPGCFSGGDCTTGPQTVVEAVSAGRKGALAIDGYLRGEVLGSEPYSHTKEGWTKDDLLETEERLKYKTDKVVPGDRGLSFSEVESEMTEDSAKKESERCLSCGCEKEDSCLLRKFATEHKVEPKRLEGEVKRIKPDISKVPIRLDSGKCILCGKCIIACLKIKKLSILGFVNRGFQAEVKPTFAQSLASTKCDACGECAKVCPTAGITAINA
ncbi:MAG: FAD-dependent oxidoreductase [bacterium]|nr:FAD-dependent oxidoreductase [bacterium]